MSLRMDVNTEKIKLNGMKHIIKNASIRVISFYYDLKTGINLNIGIFSCKSAILPILNLYYNIEFSDEHYMDCFSEDSLKKTTFLDACYNFLKTLPEFSKAKIINDNQLKNK